MSPRAAKCLRRIAANKSIPDIGALDELRRGGFITTKFPVDDGLEIKLTPLGKAFIRAEPKP